MGRAIERGLFSLGALLAVLFAMWAALGTETAAGDGPETETQSAVCADCHGDLLESGVFNPHTILDQAAEWLGEAHEGSCVSCHGDAEAHLDEGGGEGNIFAFGEDTLASVRTAACQNCHANAHPRFPSTSHAAAGMSCDSCHTIHGESETLALLQVSQVNERAGRERLGAETASCVECHEDVLTQFQFNERHRLQEGILSCTSCHNPHEPSSRLALGGFKQDGCIECHADKGGPFVFEHGSQRVEGCVACHSPHGSSNRHMLNFQRVAESCYSCHGAVPGFHSRFTLETVCTNCHSTIHGSNLDPAFLK